MTKRNPFEDFLFQIKYLELLENEKIQQFRI